MALIKCIGCFDLLREELELEDKTLVVYNCKRFFPYTCALSGLLRPGKGIVKAVKLCTVRLGDHCILCEKEPMTSYGPQRLIHICKQHDRAWTKWLDEHPQRRDYLGPKGRARQSNWIEVFREFVEDVRDEKSKSH